MGRTTTRRTPAESTHARPMVAAAKACTEAIKSRLGAIARDFWEVGELLRRMQDERLYQALGYASMRAYLDAELAVTAAQAYKMIRIVRAFVRGDAERVGIERADLLIGYAKLLGHDTDPGELVRQGAAIGATPVTAVSVRGLQDAILELKRQRTKKLAANPRAREIRRANTELARRVRRTLAATTEVGRGTVRVTPEEVVVSFSRRALEKRLRG